MSKREYPDQSIRKGWEPWLLSLHLLFPLALLLDVASAGLERIGRSEKVVVLGSLSWLLAGSIVIALVRFRPKLTPRFTGPLVSVYAVIGCVTILEIALRASTPAHNEPYIYPPGTVQVRTQSEQHLPGIQGPSVFRVNSLGMRGPDPVSPGYKIIAVGGSTTISTDLDDEEVWTQNLMRMLNGKSSERVWVSNAGIEGHTTVHHLALAEALPVIHEADLLLFLVGVNDLLFSLSSVGESTDEMLTTDARLFVERWVRRESEPLFRKSSIFHFLRMGFWRMKSTSPERRRVDERFYIEARSVRQASARAPLPDLTTGLFEYRARLERLADFCERRSIRCVFLTQPSMWRKDLPLEDERLLWAAWVDKFESAKGYLSVGDAAFAMNRYNKVLLEVCAARGLECYDLATVIPKSREAFFDDVHFNERGSRLVAEYLAENLAIPTDGTDISSRQVRSEEPATDIGGKTKAVEESTPAAIK